MEVDALMNSSIQLHAVATVYVLWGGTAVLARRVAAHLQVGGGLD